MKAKRGKQTRTFTEKQWRLLPSHKYGWELVDTQADNPPTAEISTDKAWEIHDKIAEGKTKGLKIKAHLEPYIKHAGMDIDVEGKTVKQIIEEIKSQLIDIQVQE